MFTLYDSKEVGTQTANDNIDTDIETITSEKLHERFLKMKHAVQLAEDIDARISEKRRDIEALNDQLGNECLRADSLRDKRDDVRRLQKKLETSLSSMTRTNDSLKQKIRNTCKSGQTLQQTADKLEHSERQQSHMSQQLHDIVTEIRILREQNDILETELLKERTQKQTLRYEVSSEEIEIGSLRQRLKEAAEERSLIDASLRACKEEALLHVKRAFESVEKEVRTEQEKFHQSKKTADAFVNAMYEAWARELHDYDRISVEIMCGVNNTRKYYSSRLANYTDSHTYLNDKGSVYLPKSYATGKFNRAIT